jgi:hypothetical protein
VGYNKMSRLQPTAILAILDSNEARGIGGVDSKYIGEFMQGSRYGYTTAAVPAVLLSDNTDWTPGVRCSMRYRLTTTINSPTNSRGLITEILFTLLIDAAGALISASFVLGPSVGSPPPYLAGATFSNSYVPPVYVNGVVTTPPKAEFYVTIPDTVQTGPDFYYSVEWDAHSAHYPYA